MKAWLSQEGSLLAPSGEGERFGDLRWSRRSKASKSRIRALEKLTARLIAGLTGGERTPPAPIPARSARDDYNSPREDRPLLARSNSAPRLRGPRGLRLLGWSARGSGRGGRSGARRGRSPPRLVDRPAGPFR